MSDINKQESSTVTDEEMAKIISEIPKVNSEDVQTASLVLVAHMLTQEADELEIEHRNLRFSKKMLGTYKVVVTRI